VLRVVLRVRVRAKIVCWRLRGMSKAVYYQAIRLLYPYSKS